MQDSDKTNLDSVVKEWIKRAGEDELSSKSILKHRDGAPSSVCFMSQQMVEKYLKAFLISKQENFPKIHNLERILELCIGIDPAFVDLKEESIKLTEFYIETRYPADYPEGISWEMAEEAFEMANKIKEFIESRLNC
ncbi:HEPN domain-containing protein [bacterium]|nr:MAG: HEPN domain-containing protein [bacterium]